MFAEIIPRFGVGEKSANALRTRSSVRGITCVYLLRVVVMLPVPEHLRDIVDRHALENSHVAYEWRRSWKRCDEPASPRDKQLRGPGFVVSGSAVRPV